MGGPTQELEACDHTSFFIFFFEKLGRWFVGSVIALLTVLEEATSEIFTYDIVV